MRIPNEQGYQTYEQNDVRRHRMERYFSNEVQGQRMYIVNKRKYHYRPLGVTLLAVLYALAAVLLLVMSPVVFATGYIAAPVSLMAAVGTVGSIGIGIVLGSMLAHGLWTMNSHIRTALMILSGIVMVGFASELTSGHKLGIGIFGFALLQLIYLSYPEVGVEFHEDSDD